MSADKWLAALQKAVHPAPAPHSKPAGDPLTQVLLDTAFGNCGIDDDVAIVEKATGIFDTDPYVTTLDPVGDVIEKATRDRLGVPEINAAPVHRDGIEVEKSVGGVFHFHYKGGALVKTEIFTDGGGHEIVEEHESPMYVETRLAKLAGLRPEDQHAEKWTGD